MSLSNDFFVISSRAAQTILQVFQKELQSLDVTPVQYEMLLCLMQDGNCSPTYLANYFGLEGSTITGILDRMEKKGFVYRERNPYDRRALRIVVSEKGWSIGADLLAASEKANRIVEEKLVKEDAITLKRLMSKIYKEQ